jgi:hypothetical protein
MRYPFKKMAAGESFFKPIRAGAHQNQTRSNIYYCAKIAGVRVTVSRVVEDGIDGYRVWKTSDTRGLINET